MSDPLADIVEREREKRHHALKEKVEGAARGLENLLAIADTYREGSTDPEQLGRRLGDFGGELINAGSLAEVLSHGRDKRGLSDERFARVQQTAERLRQALRGLEDAGEIPPLHDLAPEVAQHAREFDARGAEYAGILGLVRLADLEINAKYDPGRHEKLAERLDWRDLDNAESALCPPYVVLIETGKAGDKVVGQILELVTSGRPIKVACLGSPLDPLPGAAPERGRAEILQCVLAIEALPFALHNLFFLQSTPACDAEYEAHVVAALLSPRPAVLSLLAPDAPSATPSGRQAVDAVRSRAFPQFLYDPDRSLDVLTALELLDNPEPDQPWARTRLEYRVDGKSESISHRYTYADFVAAAGGSGLVHPPPAEISADRLVPLADYLELGPGRRKNHTPYVYVPGPGGGLDKAVPSRHLIVKAADRLRWWRMLQESSGVSNPHVRAMQKQLTDRLTAEKEAALQALRAELEGEFQVRERTAIENAVAGLARRLTAFTDPPHTQK